MYDDLKDISRFLDDCSAGCQIDRQEETLYHRRNSICIISDMDLI
jgi:hypothetical protein